MLISIIIPIYNTVELKLRKCLDSILCQDYLDYECLMIDDGSTDASGAICDEYAQKDSRFTVFHKVNGGVSSARNKGLEFAKGEWICFVDSDDWVKPNHLSSLLRVTSIDIDIVFCGFEGFYVDGTKLHSYDNNRYIGTTGCLKFLEETDVLKYMIPWDRMYRNKRNIRFDEKLSLGEDRLFCYQYLMHCRGIATINQITYMHDGTDENSLSYRTYPSSKNWYRYYIFYRTIQKTKKHFDEKLPFLLSHMEYLYSELRSSLIKEHKITQLYIAKFIHHVVCRSF